MTRWKRRLRSSLTLLGLGAGALVCQPSGAPAQEPDEGPIIQFGAPSGLAAPIVRPAAQFGTPQPAGQPLPVFGPRFTPVPATPATAPRASQTTAPLPAIPLIEQPLAPVPAPAASLQFQEAPPAELHFQEQAAPPAELHFQEQTAPMEQPLVLPGLVAPTPAAPGGASAWLTHPQVSRVPRPGFFAVPPTGPGNYSLLDLLNGRQREQPPAFGYPRSAIMSNGMFDTDWRYVDQPGYDPDLLERLHRVHLGDNWLFATGGEFRDRYTNEINSRLSGRDNTYDLTRVRVFGDLWYKDTFRVYAEFISAQSFWQDLPPLVIDRNYADLLNAFVDVKLFEDAAGVPWYVRGGRQQLLLGSQRLISPLDWANTMRTFDGVRAFRHGETLDLDAFWTRPVIPNASKFDSSDPQQNFAGAWLAYRPTKNQTLDLYYLYLSNNDQYNFKAKTPAPVGQLPEAPYTVHTLGYRYSGNYQNVLFDSENMLQLGRSSFSNSDLVAGSSSTGLGYNFAKAPMNPTVWAYFDYATGSSSLSQGQQFSTFNQLYPFGHYYFGWLDYVGRSNIEDLNFHVYLYPTKWLTFNAQYHSFWLASARDALYNAGGSILRYDPTGKAGRDIGQELDLILNFHLTPRQDVLAAWGHLWEGNFLKGTGPGTSAETFWLMYNVRW